MPRQQRRLGILAQQRAALSEVQEAALAGAAMAEQARLIEADNTRSAALAGAFTQAGTGRRMFCVRALAAFHDYAA